MRFSVYTLLFSLCAGGAFAQSDQVQRAIEQLLLSGPDRFNQTMISALFDIAPNGRATPETFALEQARTNAKLRLDYYQNYLIYDLDGDFNVSNDEVMRQRTVLSGKYLARLETVLIEVDKNNDDAMSLEEMRTKVSAQIANRRPSSRTSRSSSRYAILATLDMDGDEVITVSDIKAYSQARSDGEIPAPNQ